MLAVSGFKKISEEEKNESIREREKPFLHGSTPKFFFLPFGVGTFRML